MNNSQFQQEVRADIRNDIAAARYQAEHSCCVCGTDNLKDGWVLRFGSVYCHPCRTEMNCEARREIADDQKELDE